MYELLRAIRERACPECGAHESMDIQLAYYCVVCTNCRRSYIDPFDKGPWDHKVVLDTSETGVVSSYTLKGEQLPEVELNQNRLDFYKFLYGDAAKRVVMEINDESYQVEPLNI